ncbi:hypothetical protein [Paenibacillus sp. UMB4589-SE434]|uniref:hypothetical protein n=1 Tax=Paenibacillus sp. UMB4589-SE434 TaxID=3046314 RepID=UPI00254F572D|nr:hypothetical protein [Paenibacillus sp. UMB4589-SE434]MDK8183898.1 hypothetical protein [Paenibacillus sp. UMB4589-SE434]
MMNTTRSMNKRKAAASSQQQHSQWNLRWLAAAKAAAAVVFLGANADDEVHFTPKGA